MDGWPAHPPTNTMERFSRNFTRAELCVSSERPDLAEKILPSESHLENAALLAQMVLQPARTFWAKPFVVLSWLRSPSLNKAIGGYPGSDHLVAGACDFTVPGGLRPLEEIFAWMRENLPYKQIILYPNQLFIHVSINLPGRFVRHEAMVWHSGSDIHRVANNRYGQILEQSR